MLSARRAALVVSSLLLALAVGWFVFRDRPSLPERAPSRAGAHVEAAPARPTDAPPDAGEIVVRALADQNAVPGATVLLYGPLHAPRETPQDVQTSGQGVARFSIAELGRYLIVVRHAAYAVARSELEVVAARTEVAVSLERGVSIAGLVLDARGRGVSEANVRALLLAAAERAAARDGGREASPQDEPGSARTDATGRFAIDQLPVSAYRLYVHSGRHRPRWSDPISFAKHGERRDVTIVLGEGLSLRGRVLDGDRRPIAGAHVGASDEGALVAETDAEGRFELLGLGTQVVNVYATARGFAPTHLRQVSPGRRDVELVLRAPARIRGMFRFAARPRSVRIDVCRWDEAFQKELCVQGQIHEPTAESFDLRNLPPGAYDLVISVDDREAIRRPVMLAAGHTLALEIDVPAIAP
jgi:hypothetical protein